MAVIVKHPFVSAVPDGTDATVVRPSNWNADHTLTGLGTAAELNAGVANGVASLDSSGTVPVIQLPAAVLGAVSYQGTWNASTNTPTLSSSVGSKGFYYVVAVAGATNLNGITDWKVNDFAIYNGSVWQKIDNTDAVVSVNGYIGTVVLTYTDVGAQIAGTYVNSVSGVAPISSSGGATPAISMAAATVSANGYLTSIDWATFNAKQAALISGTNIKTVNSTTLLGSGDVSVGVTSVTGTAPVVSSGGATPAISMAAATTSMNGYLTAVDWTTFNNKQAAGTYVNSVAATSPLTSSGGVTPTLAMPAATSLANGYLTSADWTTFNAKQSAFGSQTANFVYASPNGSAGIPAFRAVVAADIPTLNQNTTGTAANVTGVVLRANGGTGLSVAGASGNVLTSDGTNFISAAPVSGNITTKGLYENAAIIAANYTIGTGNNAVSAGPITINSGIVVTVPSGSTWVVV